MAKKTLGYAELYWVCPNCEGINPGPEKACGQCGAPQPEDVEFQQAERQELLEDEQVKERVAAGPDIHCPYCGARNPGNAATCSQCGGDIGEGARRQSGQVLGAFQTGPTKQVPCPHCGAENPDTAAQCAQCGGSMHVDKTAPTPETAADTPAPAAKKFPVALAVILVVCCCVAAAILIFLSMRTEETTGVVDQVYWERTIQIEALGPVEYGAWDDQIPAAAEVFGCEMQVRSIESEPAPNSEEVCGTPYNVDTGSGYAEVVQDCEYHVYDEYCTYSIMEWQPVDAATRSGYDFNPIWPEPDIAAEERFGDQVETYTVFFDSADGDYSYSVDALSEFQQFQIGTEWTLEINTFGGVVSVSP